MGSLVRPWPFQPYRFRRPCGLFVLVLGIPTILDHKARQYVVTSSEIGRYIFGVDPVSAVLYTGRMCVNLPLTGIITCVRCCLINLSFTQSPEKCIEQSSKEPTTEPPTIQLQSHKVFKFKINFNNCSSRELKKKRHESHHLISLDLPHKIVQTTGRSCSLLENH